MTAETTPTDSAANYARIQAQTQERERRIAEARPANKAALFDALAAAGIASVEVAFDGSGDSGQIERITAQAGGTETALPERTIEFVEPGVGEAMNCKAVSVADAIETLVYDALEETHPGWEINDGAFGTFTFDVAVREIALSYDQRYVDTCHEDHVF